VGHWRIAFHRHGKVCGLRCRAGKFWQDANSVRGRPIRPQRQPQILKKI
jgi:hypothetical protein